MATNIVNNGDTLLYTNAGSAISAGAIVAVNGILYVALVDIAASGGTGVIATNVAVEAPKVSAAVILAGESVGWDVSAGAFDDKSLTPATGDVTGAAARAIEAGVDTQTTIQVKLTGVKGTVA